MKRLCITNDFEPKFLRLNEKQISSNQMSKNRSDWIENELGNRRNQAHRIRQREFTISVKKKPMRRFGNACPKVAAKKSQLPPLLFEKISEKQDKTFWKMPGAILVTLSSVNRMIFRAPANLAYAHSSQRCLIWVW